MYYAMSLFLLLVAILAVMFHEKILSPKCPSRIFLDGHDVFVYNKSNLEIVADTREPEGLILQKIKQFCLDEEKILEKKAQEKIRLKEMEKRIKKAIDESSQEYRGRCIEFRDIGKRRYCVRSNTSPYNFIDTGIPNDWDMVTTSTFDVFPPIDIFIEEKKQGAANSYKVKIKNFPYCLESSRIFITYPEFNDYFTTEQTVDGILKELTARTEEQRELCEPPPPGTVYHVSNTTSSETTAGITYMKGVDYFKSLMEPKISFDVGSSTYLASCPTGTTMTVQGFDSKTGKRVY